MTPRNPGIHPLDWARAIGVGRHKMRTMKFDGLESMFPCGNQSAIERGTT